MNKDNKNNLYLDEFHSIKGIDSETYRNFGTSDRKKENSNTISRELKAEDFIGTMGKGKAMYLKADVNTKEVIISNNAVIQVLEYMNHFVSISLKRLRESVLHNAKSNRKGLTREKIIEKGLNIYPKTGIQIDTLIEELIGQNYIEVQYKNELEVSISPKGSDYLMGLYTDNFCDSFLTYKDKINELTQKRNQTDFDPVHVAGMFYYKKDLGEIENTYFTNKQLQEEAQTYHEYMLDKYDLKPNSNDFILHLIPKLFLPVEDMWEDVELTIKGIELPKQPIFTDRPYPNQRYIVGGIEIEKGKFTTGFYPIIAPKDEFPKEKSICYHWKLGNGKEIIHDIHIEFEIDRGNLFSTDQSLSRSNDLSNVQIVTFVEDDPSFKRNRTIEYLNINKEILHIKENVVLTSFPNRLHSCFYGDKYYERWREKRKGY